MTASTNESVNPGIMDYFPLGSPRPTQTIVLKEIDSLFKRGKRIVILEAPVGSGKSAIALTLARQQAANPSRIYSEGGEPPPAPVHILTPRKSLQDQYFHDFSQYLVLMKGRNAYPCIIDEEPKVFIPILESIRKGKVEQPKYGSPNCSEAPCRGNSKVYSECTETHDCPYTLAVAIAQENPIVVHNLHSFLYQTNFSDKFQKRSLMIIDEAHEIENTVRDFAKRKVVVKGIISESGITGLKTLKDWGKFLMTPTFVPEETDRDKAAKLIDENFVSARAEYLKMVSELEAREEYYKSGFSVEIGEILDPTENKQIATIFEFVPHYVGNEVQRLLLAHGDKVLLMSGTIYDKGSFCKQLGIASADAHFIRIPSSFPLGNRPIYALPEFQTDTSHGCWGENFNDMIDIVHEIMAKFDDAKGLIHAPSYSAAKQIAKALNSRRVVTHGQSDFLYSLEKFFESKGNQVLLSPVCQQGVDFKEDRARFQIILRVPFMSVSSTFVKDKMQMDFPWYNYQALVTFGQQVGRVNRSEEDYGATFLVDSRFNKFISKNKGVLPTWLTDAIKYKRN